MFVYCYWCYYVVVGCVYGGLCVGVGRGIGRVSGGSWWWNVGFGVSVVFFGFCCVVGSVYLIDVVGWCCVVGVCGGCCFVCIVFWECGGVDGYYGIGSWDWYLVWCICCVYFFGVCGYWDFVGCLFGDIVVNLVGYVVVLGLGMV